MSTELRVPSIKLLAVSYSAMQRHYLSEAPSNHLPKLCDERGRILNGLINSPARERTSMMPMDPERRSVLLGTRCKVLEANEPNYH